MKKIGLITYYGENYGGMLQAYALQKYIKSLGYTCKIISNDFLYAKNSRRDIKWLKNKIKDVMKNPLEYMHKRNAIRMYKNENELKSIKFLEFREKYIDIDNIGYSTYQQYQECPPIYDVYVCGSDQIWNPNLYMSNGFYFADFAPKKYNVISYASSIGVSEVNDDQASFMRPLLNRINTISVRENEGADIVKEITGKNVRTVLDPTLLLNSEDWDEVCAPPVMKKPYIFCYLFGERPYVENVKKQVKELTGLEIVSIPFVAREMIADEEKIFNAGPAEFISLIKNAELVLTDSFHATVFSINYKTPFLTLCRFSKKDRKGMNSRLTTILTALGLEDRLIDDTDSITHDFLFDLDFAKAYKLLQARRSEDSDFLISAIEKSGE